MTQNSVISSFLERLRDAPASTLLLDYDGTLAPFHTDRHSAIPYPGVLPALERILHTGRTEIVIVSGRPIQEVMALMTPLNHLAVWGSHGMERRTASGEYRQHPASTDILSILHEAEADIVSAGRASLLEKKPGGVVLHWRGLSAHDAESLREHIEPKWSAYAKHTGLKLLRFDGGLELRLAKPDKGDAVQACLKEATRGTAIAFLGDDMTDEDGFTALGAHGLSILVRPEYRKTSAQAWLKPPEELLGFFSDWFAATSS